MNAFDQLLQEHFFHCFRPRLLIAPRWDLSIPLHLKQEGDQLLVGQLGVAGGHHLYWALAADVPVGSFSSTGLRCHMQWQTWGYQASFKTGDEKMYLDLQITFVNFLLGL